MKSLTSGNAVAPQGRDSLSKNGASAAEMFANIDVQFFFKNDANFFFLSKKKKILLGTKGAFFFANTGRSIFLQKLLILLCLPSS